VPHTTVCMYAYIVCLLFGLYAYLPDTYEDAIGEIGECAGKHFYKEETGRCS